MKIVVCTFSGYKIYPGHGKTLVKSDGRTLTFLSSKAERCYLLRRNPRKVSWTELYRRKHRKGYEQEIIKKKARHFRKIDKSICGKSLNDILAIRKLKPEVKKAQKEDAIRIAKQARRSSKASKNGLSSGAKGKTDTSKMPSPHPQQSSTKFKTNRVQQKGKLIPRSGNYH